MNRLLVVLTIVSVALPSAPTGSLAAFAAPSSATVRWGFEESSEYSNVPMVATTWSMRPGLSLWTGGSYIHEQRRFPARYLPLTLGLRAGGGAEGGRRGGPFVEAGPSLVPAWYLKESGRFGFAMMGGFQVGAGMRLGTIRGTHTELGLSYHVAEAFGRARGGYGRIGTPQEIDVSLATVYVAFGIGD